MTEPSELRRFAMQCMECAQALTDPDARAAWLEMAANWLRIAGANQRASGVKQQQQQIQPDEAPKA
jgi:hypothetical protein